MLNHLRCSACIGQGYRHERREHFQFPRLERRTQQDGVSREVAKRSQFRASIAALRDLIEDDFVRLLPGRVRVATDAPAYRSGGELKTSVHAVSLEFQS